MCKLCAIAVRYSRPRQDSLVFDLSQFAVAATNPLTQQSQVQQPQTQQSQVQQPQIQQLQNQSGQQIQEKFP